MEGYEGSMYEDTSLSQEVSLAGRASQMVLGVNCKGWS
jgi:hypothetical protein